ncbi:histidine phosphatase family protein [Luteimonas dalianensis]|uniref:histidine phosphatase family protein n=1 Tax=Luteimonas dalianensis TaxID=1148196 RepID=UPI003BF28422
MRLLLPLLLLAALAGCALHPAGSPLGRQAQEAGQELQTTFIVVRHAEKSTEDPEDPRLDADGQARAQALAEVLADVPLKAIYSTPTRRTRETAAPTAAAMMLEVRDYDPELAPSELATMLHIRHAGDTVLLVGHSNTVPGIVTALCACPVDPMTESEYGDLFLVRIAAGGEARLERERF